MFVLFIISPSYQSFLSVLYKLLDTRKKRSSKGIMQSLQVHFGATTTFFCLCTISHQPSASVHVLRGLILVVVAPTYLRILVPILLCIKKGCCPSIVLCRQLPLSPIYSYQCSTKYGVYLLLSKSY